MPEPKRSKVRAVVKAVTSEVWMIRPDKLEEICELLEMRSAGMAFTEEEIESRIGVMGLRSRREDDDVAMMAGGVAVIPVHGTTSPRMNLMMHYSGGVSTHKLRAQISEAVANGDVKAIVLDMDTPGGSALGNQEVVDVILELRDKKPIIASVNGECCSAGYYIASACNKIFASPSSVVGSIGCVMIHRESKQADTLSGNQYTVFRSSKFKADGNDREPLTAQSTQTLQERVDMFSEQFVEAVGTNRSQPIASVLSQFGDGKIMLADAALSAGMIDGVKTLAQVVGDLGQSNSSGATRSSSKGSKMDPLKAVLFSHGLVESVDCSDETCQKALLAFGLTTECSVQDLVTAIKAQEKTDDTATDTKTSVDSSADAASDEGALTQFAESAAAAERNRIAEINAMADLVGGLPKELVTQAIDEGWDPGKFATQARHARREGFESINTIQGGPSAIEKFNDAACTAILQQCGMETADGDAPAQDLAGQPISELALRSLEAGNQVPPRGTSRLKIAQMFLQQGGQVMPMSAIGGASNDPAYHGSGSFPNLLSVLANKILDRAMMTAPSTYPRWTGRMQDLNDFKPATIVGVGDFHRLPLHNVGRPFAHSDFGEQVSWIQVDSYGQEFVLTPDMIVNDDMDGFTQAMRSQGVAHELTLNQLAVDLLISNPVTADGKVMFSNGAGNHNNLVDGNGGTPGGSAPDSQGLSNNRLLHRRQKSISGGNKLRYDAKIVLVSPVHETVAEQTMQKRITPRIEGEVNVFEDGRYEPVVEVMLDEAATLNAWYSFVDPVLVRAIVHAFQTGYGRGGRRRTYFREETQCRHFQFEGRFGVAAVNHQGVVKNVGP